MNSADARRVVVGILTGLALAGFVNLFVYDRRITILETRADAMDIAVDRQESAILKRLDRIEAHLIEQARTR